MTNSTKTKVIIIEDNEDLIDGYVFMFSMISNFELVGKFTNCESAFENIIELKPKIVIMDIDLPGMSGIDGTLKLKKILPNCEILINTVFENSETVFKALCAGASGYITKSSGHKEIFAALEEILTGGAPMSANIARMVVKSFQKSNNSPLTDREYDVLKALADGKSYKTISQELNLSLGTVKFHIKNIYMKLEVNNKEEAIKKVKTNKWI